MAQCEVCGNDYHLSFEVIAEGQTHTFDSFECAIHKLAPDCAHCGCKIIGHGIEAKGVVLLLRPLRPGPWHPGGGRPRIERPLLRLRVLFGIVSGTRGISVVPDESRHSAERAMTVQFIPPGYHTITPYLIVSGLPGTIAFLETVFDAKTTVAPMLRPDGTIMHTELQVGDSRIMMAEATEQWKPMPCLDLPVPARLRRQLQARRRGRCHIAHGAGRPVLWRPHGRRARPVRQPVVGRHARGGRDTG